MSDLQQQTNQNKKLWTPLAARLFAEQIRQAHAKLECKQQRLGPKFEEVLLNNLWELYEAAEEV